VHETAQRSSYLLLSDYILNIKTFPHDKVVDVRLYSTHHHNVLLLAWGYGTHSAERPNSSTALNGSRDEISVDDRIPALEKLGKSEGLPTPTKFVGS
jgi:hypothetical protein